VIGGARYDDGIMLAAYQDGQVMGQVAS